MGSVSTSVTKSTLSLRVLERVRVDLTPYRKSSYESAIHRNPCSCGKHRVPVVIPPTCVKDITNQCLTQVWSRAEKELKEVDRLVFCGYSLPPTDLPLRHMLKRAQVNRNRAQLRALVINGREAHDKTEKQYESFFGAAGPRKENLLAGESSHEILVSKVHPSGNCT